MKNIIFKENYFFENTQHFIFYYYDQNESDDFNKLIELMIFLIVVLLPFLAIHRAWISLEEKKKVVLDYNFKFLVCFQIFMKKN